MSREAMKQALEALKSCSGVPHWPVLQPIIKDLKQAIAEAEKQEPVAWMGTDVEGNPNKFRLNFFGGAIPLFCLPEDKHLVATNEKDGSPCPEFWEWLPKAYNFDGDGNFTKYNMEVAFLAGKQSVATNDTSQERVDETEKQRHEAEKQEPVAWITQGGKGWLRWHKPEDNNTDSVPLYTTPPQRTWVGLTDEDIALFDWESFKTKKDCSRAIEQALKEKNNVS